MKEAQAQILVVDDLGINRDILGRQLERRGFAVRTASGGKQALEMLTASEFNVVLLDIMMPEFSGIETLKEIRANQHWKELPIIMVTGQDERQGLKECFDCGANDYVTKPVHIPVLCARIEAQLSRKFALDAALHTQGRLVELVNERTNKLQRAIASLEHEIAEREQIRMEAVHSKTRLLDAIEALNDGFALFDVELKLQVANQTFYELFELPLNQDSVGSSYEELLRRVVDKGVIPAAVGKEEKWIKPQLISDEIETELLVSSERWLQIIQRKTSEGERVVICRDITIQKQSEAVLLKAALHDPLTGLYNRRHFMTVLSGEVARWQRYQTSLSMIMMDIDYFKNVNDTYGHEVGDKVLCRITRLLTKKLRKCDTLARWGGEEFVALLPDTNQDQARVLGDRIREILSENPIRCGSEHLNTTLSIGVTSMNRQLDNAKDFLAEADQALYRAKESGRNKVSV